MHKVVDGRAKAFQARRRKLTEDFPQDAELGKDLVAVWKRLADHVAQGGDVDQALVALREALTARARLSPKGVAPSADARAQAELNLAIGRLLRRHGVRVGRQSRDAEQGPCERARLILRGGRH